MKVRFNRWYNAILTALLSMLGYGCSLDEPEEYGPIVMEYGVPHADYMVKGTVTDEAGTPIRGIKTALKGFYPGVEEVYVDGIDSIQTDASGQYQLKYEGAPHNYLKLIVEDIDGEANGGEFLGDTLDISFDKGEKLKDGNGNWYMGEFEIQKDIKLKKKP